MAEAAAEKAVTFVLDKLAAVLVETVREVQAVRGLIEKVRKELCLIQGLLSDVDSNCKRKNVVTAWLNQVKEIADKIATIIDTFRVKIEENSAESSNWFGRKFTTAKTNYKTYKLGLHDELEKIIEELEWLYKRRTDLRIDDLGALNDVDAPKVVGHEDDQGKIIEQLGDRSISRRTVLSIVGTGGLGKTTLAQKVYNSDKLEGHHPEHHPEPCDDVDDPEPCDVVDDPEPCDVVDDPEPCDVVDDSEVVGLKDDQAKIIEQLLDRSNSRRTVLSIVGIGGLGKTTLAEKVYNSDKLEGQFDCRAWLSISQEYKLNELLRKILYKVRPDMKKKDPPVTDRDLPLKLKNFLRGKRYLIILDDVWDINLWGQLKMGLPDICNASRVIITSRSLDVATAADYNTIPYKLRYLSDDEGLTLLFKNAFQQHVQPENYPHLLHVAKSLTKKCGGLPMALIVLAGILARRDPIYTAWNMLDDTIDWHDEDGKQCSQVLARSYEVLPQYLKYCFLYFAAFPKDHKISVQHVTRMWVADGFIPNDGDGTIEDRAEECLLELVKRCLIQVTNEPWSSYCKYVSMHNLLRDLAIRKAKDENFFTVFSEKNINNLAASKPCRAALQFCTPTKDGIYSENTHSLLCFGFGKSSLDKSGFRLLNYSGFRSLRVLTLKSVNMATFTWSRWPKGMINLRYLGLRDCNIPYRIFVEFSSDNLETIDLKGSQVYDIFGKKTLDLCGVVIPTLRHVYGSLLFHIPLEWNKHTNLQTIRNVPIQMKSVGKLGFCNNLRTLAICIEDNLDNERVIEEWRNLKSVLRKAEQLVHLTIGTYGFLPFGGTQNLLCHGKIQKLVLKGNWEKNICVLSVEMFPTNLTKLKLIDSRLEEDPMPTLERLHSLKIFSLCFKSYMGTELICSTGGFPNLENLKLMKLPKLCHWEIEEGAMPILCRLEIGYCYELHVLPELQNVRTLQELTVHSPSYELSVDIQMQRKDGHKIKHIPSVHIRKHYCVGEEEEDMP